MRHERQMELLDRFLELRDAKSTPLADKLMNQPAAKYVDAELFDRERSVFFRGMPLLVGLSGDAARPGDYLTADVAGIPVVVIRGEDGLLRALVNVCRHRGAQVFPDERGHLQGRGVACPFHSWTYDMYGKLLGQPLAREGFRECDADLMGLREVHVTEHRGMVFVQPTEAGAPDPDPADMAEWLGQAGTDLGDFGLGSYTLAESRTRTFDLNWKLVLDTFLESYHIFSLHRGSIGPWYFSAPNIYDEFPSGALVSGVRSNIAEELEKPRDERSLIPFATFQYFVYPNAVVVHQFDHIEIWQVYPGDTPTTSRVITSIYGPGEMTDKARRYYVKNLDLLIGVTDSEDFPQAERTQRALAARATDGLVFGRNEPGLIHFHHWIDRHLHA